MSDRAEGWLPRSASRRPREPMTPDRLEVLVYSPTHLLASRGTPLRARNLTSWLARRPGVAVKLLSLDASAEVADTLGLDHLPIGRRQQATSQLQQAVQAVRPDVVYAMTHKGAFDLARLPPARRPRRVADLHGDPAWEKLEDRQRSPVRRLKGFLSSRLGERRAFPRIDGFTVVSEALRRRVEEVGKPAELLLGGVDTDSFRLPPPAAGDQITVGYAGSFRSYQGVDDLVTAACRLLARGGPFRFLLIGDLATLPELRRRIERGLGDSATLLPQVDQARLPELLGRCDVLVVPRRHGRAAEHNYPSKLSEFLALGRAVVVTDVGQAGELARSSGVALTVPAASPTALAEALERLRDPELRRRLGGAARAYAVEHLDWRRIAARLEGFLRRLAPRE